MRITPYFLDLIQRSDGALGRQVIPDPAELEDRCQQTDPLTEEQQSPAPLIIHRYPRRVIFLVSNQCAIYCRFCMRKRRVGMQHPVKPDDLRQALNYIRNCHEINEVVLSGGDPLMLGDEELTETLAALRRIAHVRVLRLHTRVPCAWPERITQRLARRLAAFHPLYINIHFNHPDEITPQAAVACSLLADAGMALGSQTVLLRGVNDRSEVLSQLFETLLGIRVKPYYLHQIDRVRGTAHFQVPLARSLELAAGLRGGISGMAVPHFVIDLPGGGGKIELLGDAIVEKQAEYWLIRNFQGRIFRYPLSA
jgi:lysine 2,3-aminomutase